MSIIIDTTNAEHAHIPVTLEGEVLLVESPDGGFLTIKPETLKWFGENKTAEELTTMGYDDYASQITEVLAMSEIIAEDPQV